MASIEAEIAAQFAGALEIEHELDKFAHQICDELKDRAPVFDSKRDKRATPGIGEEAGEFRDSIQVTPAGPHRRRVGSQSPIALWQEVGTRHFPEMGIFAQVAALHDGTGPVIEDVGIQHAQTHLREHLEKLEKLAAEGASAASIAAAKVAVERARGARSAAFRAARGGRGRGGRRGR